MSNQPGMRKPPFPHKKSAHSCRQLRIGQTYVARDGDGWGVGQDEFDLIQALTPAPVLDAGSPSVTCVAEAV